MMDSIAQDHSELARLRAENEKLREIARQWSTATEKRFPRAWNLTSREQRVLVVLAGSTQTISRERIFNLVWGPESEVCMKSLDMVIMRLRRKLRERGVEIINEWGMGIYCPAATIAILRAALE